MGSWCFAPINTVQLNSTLPKQADCTFAGRFHQVNSMVNRYFQKSLFSQQIMIYSLHNTEFKPVLLACIQGITECGVFSAQDSILLFQRILSLVRSFAQLSRYNPSVETARDWVKHFGFLWSWLRLNWISWCIGQCWTSFKVRWPLTQPCLCSGQFENLGRTVNWSQFLEYRCVLSESSPLLAHRLKLLLDKTKILAMSFLLAKKHSPRQQSVTAQGGTYLVKSKQIQHRRFFSSWQSLANKPALHKLTNILVITGSNISNSAGLWGVWSADASCGSFPFHSLPLSPQSAVRYRVIPGFTLLRNWRKRAVLLAAFKRSQRNRTARFHWHCTHRNLKECGYELSSQYRCFDY